MMRQNCDKEIDSYGFYVYANWSLWSELIEWIGKTNVEEGTHQVTIWREGDLCLACGKSCEDGDFGTLD